MGAEGIYVLILHFKQNVSHFMPQHIFGAGTVGASRVKNLPPQPLFPNPKLEMYMYMCVCVCVYMYIFYFISERKSKV